MSRNDTQTKRKKLAAIKDWNQGFWGVPRAHMRLTSLITIGGLRLRVRSCEDRANRIFVFTRSQIKVEASTPWFDRTEDEKNREVVNRRRSQHPIPGLLDYYPLLLSRFRSTYVTESVVASQRSSQPRDTKGESIRVMPPPLLLPPCERATLESRAFAQLSFIFDFSYNN